MPFVLFLLGAAAVALVATQAKAQPKGEGRTYTLDSNLSPQLRAQVLGALQRERDPAKLSAFAAQLAQGGYPLSALALTQRAMELGGVPSLPQPAPGQQVQPQPWPIPAGVYPAPMPAPTPAPAPAPAPTLFPGVFPSPAPAPGPAPTSNPFALDPGMPPAMQSAVLGALTTETDPAKLAAFAQEIQGQYPILGGPLDDEVACTQGGRNSVAVALSRRTATPRRAPVAVAGP